MGEYVKLHTSFKERLLFFFTGLINKKYIISIVRKPEQVTIVKENVEEKVDEPDFEVKIPFFEFDGEDTKSNL